MDKWLVPALIVLVVLGILLPIMFAVYGALVGLVAISAVFNASRLPGPYLSLLDGGDGLRLNWLARGGDVAGGRSSRAIIMKEKAVVKEVEPDKIVSDPSGGDLTIMSAAITCLVPGETYRYEIQFKDGRGRTKSRWGGRRSWFRFPRLDREPGGIRRIAALGDMQPKSIMPPLLQAAIMHQVDKSRPDIFVYLGDHTNTGNDTRAWLWYLRLVGIVARHTPVIGTPGNHDAMKKNKNTIASGNDAYDRFVNYPGNHRHYHVKFGGIHFVSLDYQEPVAPGSPQLDLVTGVCRGGPIAPHEGLLVFSHSTPYNTAIKPADVPPSIADMRTHVSPLIQNFNAVWLGGHEHAYQKFTVNGIPYITTAATSSFHYHEYTSEFMDMNVKKYHFVLIDVNDQETRVTALALTGKAIDEFAIRRR